MITAFLSVVYGLALLVCNADRFVEVAASAACHLGMLPLLIGMVVVGVRHVRSGDDGFGDLGIPGQPGHRPWK